MLSTQQRARLVKFVENNPRMPAAAKERILKRLNATNVPKKLVERLRGQITGKKPNNSSQSNGEN